MTTSQKRGVLILEDGTEFTGWLFGAELKVPEGTEVYDEPIKDKGYGEVVFNTSMTGYQEILTDPSYYGQIVCMTVPHLGNTGVNSVDQESAKAWCAGWIIHDLTESPSNWRSQASLDQFLKQEKIPALMGVDTRSLTLHLRSRGVTRGILLPETRKHLAQELLARLPSFEGRDLISEVTTREPYLWNRTGRSKNEFSVVAIDYGAKWNLLKELERRNCQVEVVPASTSAESILARSPSGVFLSNGPGDPAAAPYTVETIRQLLGKLPIFGVCMGHQLLALALGGKTYKLKFGHRGGNQPVLEKESGRVEISSHNHGYAVDGDSLPRRVQLTHFNLNDKTVEGLCDPELQAFSVQYHPEACPGPHDSLLLFDRFIEFMRKNVSKIS